MLKLSSKADNSNHSFEWLLIFWEMKFVQRNSVDQPIFSSFY